MMKRRIRLLGRLRELIDDVLPMPPDQRRERDDDGADHSEYRRRRLRLHMLEKRGKGGYR